MTWHKKDFKQSRKVQNILADFIVRNKKLYKVYSEINRYEKSIIRFGNDIGKVEIENLGQLEFYDNGRTINLVEKASLWNPKQFFGAFSESKWKTAFLKKNVKIPLPYGSIVVALRRTMKKRI